ncbi:MAG: hypothetical protein K2M89_07815 [Clostridiales bacterium]|nr:hypothetical protein [Clostridiales bacterium]
MRTRIDEDTIFKLAEASVTSVCRAQVANIVSKQFRSMHYLSSMLICDCVTLNLLLNDKITPISADEIITCIRRRNKSFYTTVDSAYFPIEDRFEEYAKTVLGEKYDNVRALNMRTTNYIIYVISVDLSDNYELYPQEIYSLAYSYEELANIKELPHY